jgi:hypothetical protein
VGLAAVEAPRVILWARAWGRSFRPISAAAFHPRESALEHALHHCEAIDFFVMVSAYRCVADSADSVHLPSHPVKAI